MPVSLRRLDRLSAASWRGPTLPLKSLRRGGRLVTCGATTGSNPPADLRRVFIRQLSIYGSTGGHPQVFLFQRQKAIALPARSANTSLATLTGR